MCGIAGILGDDRPPAAAVAEAETMAATLVHRGPDDTGVEGGEGWALGMTRLAVQDLSAAGHQPMTRGDHTIAFNGEVYNFPELRTELETLGHRFRSRTDTEVVINAFREWGPEAFSRFNGMFALAIVDRVRRRVWLARDRWGKKPLFIARVGARLLFASELKAILSIARSQLTLSRTGLAGYFRFLYVPTPQTIFEQVTKLPAASWVELELAGVSERARGSFAAGDDQAAASGPVEPARVLEAVREAVRRRLIADVPVGAFLSGGVDSSLIVACMCNLTSDVRTFAIGFDEAAFDETVHAEAIAGRLGTTHTTARVSSEEARGLLVEMPTAFDEPFADSSAIPTMAVAKLAREQVTVALSGDGGDELFGGYTRYRHPPPVRAVAALPRLLPARVAASPRLRDRHARLSAYAGSSTLGAGYEEIMSAWRRAELDRLVPGAHARGPVRAAADAVGGGPVERMMRADIATYLSDDILQKVDRATMAVSLEARNPLLDPAVVSLAYGEMARSGREPTAKRLLREAVELELPGALTQRPKRGFSAPVGAWFRGPLKPMVEDLVLARSEAEYDLDEARAVCSEHLEGTREAAAKVLSLVAFELWRQRWWS